MCSLLLRFWIVFLNWTEYCQDHQAETHEEQQDEVLEEEVWREPVGAMLSVLQVLVHAVYQAVGPGAVTQLSAGFVDLEGVTHSYAPHLHGRRTQSTSVTKLLKVTSSGKQCYALMQPDGCLWLLHLLTGQGWTVGMWHTHTQVKILFSHLLELFFQNYLEQVRQICLYFSWLYWGHFLLTLGRWCFIQGLIMDLLCGSCLTVTCRSRPTHSALVTAALHIHEAPWDAASSPCQAQATQASLILKSAGCLRRQQAPCHHALSPKPE